MTRRTYQKLEDLVWNLYHPDRVDPLRVVQVDMDYIFDKDPAQQKRNLDRLLDRIKDMKINTVFLQAFADPDGNGTADALYFPNRYLPVRADLFNRVAWQLKTRAGVKVYAWLRAGRSCHAGADRTGGNPFYPCLQTFIPF